MLKARWLAAGLIILALLLAVAGFAGWVLANETLKTFGVPGFPIRPWATVAYALLAVAAAASASGKQRVAASLAALPALLGLWTIPRHLGLVEVEIYRPFFPNQLARSGLADPSLPSVGAAISFLLLASAIFTTPRRPRRIDDANVLFALAALLNGIAGSVIILLVRVQGGASNAFLASLPASLITVVIALALMVPRSRQNWVTLRSGGGDEWRSFRRSIPAMLILPILPSLLGFWIERYRLLSPAGADIAVAAGNVLIVATLIAWATAQVLRQQGELSYLGRALDSSRVALVTPDGVITHWSAGCEQLYGYSRADAVGRRKYELLQSRPSHGGPLPLHPSPDDEEEFTEVRSDGTEICVIERRQLADIPDREPLIVLKLTDITERVRVEAALRESEQRLALAMAAHEVGVFEWDVKTGAMIWSPGAEQRLGFEPGTMRDYDSWRSMIVQEDEHGVRESLKRAIESRADRFSFRCRLKPVDGISRSIEGSSRCIYDAVGKLVRTVGVCLETTERDDREAALGAREVQLRSILETVPEAMVIVDDEGIIHDFSKTAERIWGYSADEVLGRSFAMLVTKEEAQRYARGLKSYLETGQTTAIGRTISGTGLTKDGREFPAEMQVGMARSGGELRITVFFTDISDRLQSEERLSDINNELAHLSRQGAMSELAADLAHELNQPLAAISNLVATARMMTERRDDPGRIVEILRMGGEQTMRAGDIIRRMRAFMAKRDVDMRAESLEELVRDTIQLVMVGTRPFDIRLDYDFDPAARQIFVDRVQIQQVLVNLLRNAIDALRDQPRAKRRIAIASRRLEDGMVQIEMRDTGPGIPSEVISNLYERFSTTKGDNGTGIGLSISRRIVEAHGGTLVAENRPEGGASFRFTVPAEDPDED